MIGASEHQFREAYPLLLIPQNHLIGTHLHRDHHLKLWCHNHRLSRYMEFQLR